MATQYLMSLFSEPPSAPPSLRLYLLPFVAFGLLWMALAACTPMGVSGLVKAALTLPAAKPRGMLHTFIEIQGYGYIGACLVFIASPSLARTFLFIFEDKQVWSDAAVRGFFTPVVSVGWFYVVAGRAANDQHVLACMINRLLIVSAPAVAFYLAGMMDLGITLIMVSYDGGCAVATAVMYANMGAAGLKPSEAPPTLI